MPAARGLRPPWSLRSRLVLGILALLALVILVVGAASGLALRAFLIGQLDARLGDAAQRTEQALGVPSPGVVVPAQGPGTLAVIVAAGGGTLSGRLDDDGATVDLTAEQLDALTALLGDGGPRRAETVDLPGLGAYRVVVGDVRSGGSLVIGMPLSEVEAIVARLAAISAVVGVVALLGAAGLGLLVVRLALRPLDRLAATAGEVSRLPLDREAAIGVRVPDADADERTEVGRVGASFNRMLDHVRASLEARDEGQRRLRRFVADASHELRTPLASIRGYAELTRRGGETAPPPVAHALGRIESESVRMTALVEDLLLLARLDEETPLRSDPVDLVEVLVTAVSDAQVADEDHDWSVEVPEGPVTVDGDAARLHQVALNLLGNAGRHTPAGTSVVGRVRLDGDAAVLEVEDDGPGIDPELLPAVFGRFVRGDASRARATGSTGLGLAIVQAVATAHGGTVSVESVPGRTVFSVRIPV